MPCGQAHVGRGRLIGMLAIVSRASLKSTTFAPSTASPRGIPADSVSRLRFVPDLARSVGLGPLFFPSQRRLRHRAIHGQPVPVDADEFVVSFQRSHPGLLENTRFGPFERPLGLLITFNVALLKSGIRRVVNSRR